MLRVAFQVQVDMRAPSAYVHELCNRLQLHPQPASPVIWVGIRKREKGAQKGNGRIGHEKRKIETILEEFAFAKGERTYRKAGIGCTKYHGARKA